MLIGAILPAGDSGDTPASWARVRDFGLSAEQGGLHSVWLFDHLFHESEGGRTAPSPSRCYPEPSPRRRRGASRCW